MTEDIPLEVPLCFLNKRTGDLFIVYYPQNAPKGDDWVEISKECFEVLTGDRFHKKG